MVGSLMVMFVFVLISGVPIIFWVWAIIDCLRRSEDSFSKLFGDFSPKLAWLLIIFFGNLIGAILYVLIAGSKKAPRKTIFKVDPAATEEGQRILKMISEGKVSPEEGQRLISALGTKEIEKVEKQTGGIPVFAWVGCLVLVLFPLLLVLGATSYFMAVDPEVNSVSVTSFYVSKKAVGRVLRKEIPGRQYSEKTIQEIYDMLKKLKFGQNLTRENILEGLKKIDPSLGEENLARAFHEMYQGKRSMEWPSVKQPD